VRYHWYATHVPPLGARVAVPATLAPSGGTRVAHFTVLFIWLYNQKKINDCELGHCIMQSDVWLCVRTNFKGLASILKHVIFLVKKGVTLAQHEWVCSFLTAHQHKKAIPNFHTTALRRHLFCILICDLLSAVLLKCLLYIAAKHYYIWCHCRLLCLHLCLSVWTSRWRRRLIWTARHNGKTSGWLL